MKSIGMFCKQSLQSFTATRDYKSDCEWLSLADDCPKQRGSLWRRQRWTEACGEGRWGEIVEVQGNHHGEWTISLISVFFFNQRCRDADYKELCNMKLNRMFRTTIERFPESRLMREPLNLYQRYRPMCLMCFYCFMACVCLLKN